MRKTIHLAFLSFTFILLSLMLTPVYAKSQTPDQTSWGNINQPLLREDDWQQIVTDSKFQLGPSSLQKVIGGSIKLKAYGTYPSLDGSTVSVPMAVEFARQHLALADDETFEFVIFNTTHAAYERLILSQPNAISFFKPEMAFMDNKKPVDLILATAPSEAEKALAKKHHVDLILEPVCYDAFVFITGKENPVDSLTVEQIQKIYTGEITNWKEVGGQDKLIEPYQRDPNSGSQTAMETLVMQGKPMLPPEKITAMVGMGELVKTVGEYQNSESSLGYTYLYYIDILYKHENIKVLQINEVNPTRENLISGSYPFKTNYFAVIRAEDKDATGGQFMDWILSDEGQRCIQQAGYLPLRETD